MIEFPRRPRTDSTGEAQTAQSVPAWRAELSERVRAARAKRASNEAAPNTVSNSAGSTVGAAPARQEVERVEPVTQTESPDELTTDFPNEINSRTSNPIVEAALTRVRRASEQMPRTTMGNVDAGRPVPANGFLGTDRQATARALDVQPEVTPAARNPVPTVAEKGSAEVEKRRIIISDELEPCDYLEAEIRKVDRALSAEFSKNESPSLAVHFVIGFIDMVAIALSSAPFMILIASTTGFASTRSRIGAGTIVALIAFFYLVVTQALCAKTFGMMLTNTKVVNANTFESVSPGRALARTIGYFVSLAPAAIGFIWTLGNKKRRGWHDFLAGTLVARDF